MSTKIKVAKSFDLSEDNIAHVGYVDEKRGNINRLSFESMKLSEIIDIHNANSETPVTTFKSKLDAAKAAWDAIADNCATILTNEEADAKKALATPLAKGDDSGDAATPPKDKKAPVAKVAKEKKEKAPKEPKAPKGTNLKPKAILKPVRKGTNQHKVLVAIAAEKGATMKELQALIGATKNNEIAPESSIKAIFGWDLNNQKGYGVESRFNVRGPDTGETFHLVLPQGVSEIPEPTDPEAAKLAQKANAEAGRQAAQAKKAAEKAAKNAAKAPATPAPAPASDTPAPVSPAKAEGNSAPVAPKAPAAKAPGKVAGASHGSKK